MVLGYGAALSGHKLSVNLCHLEQILCLPPETYYYKRRLGLVIQHNKLQHVANLEKKRQPGKKRDNLEKTQRDKNIWPSISIFDTWVPEREHLKEKNLLPPRYGILGAGRTGPQ